jgi:hypothetical protein
VIVTCIIGQIKIGVLNVPILMHCCVPAVVCSRYVIMVDPRLLAIVREYQCIQQEIADSSLVCMRENNSSGDSISLILGSKK